MGAALFFITEALGRVGGAAVEALTAVLGKF